MSQPSIASYFNTRKRPATDDIISTKNKYYSAVPSSVEQKQENLKSGSIQTRSGRTIKRTVSTESAIKTKTAKISGEEPTKKVQQKLVEFVKKGYLSPNNKLSSVKDVNQTFATKETNVNKSENVQKKQQISSGHIEKEKLKNLVKKELNFDEVKTKVTRSAKLQELKASLGRLKELEKTRKAHEEKNKQLRNADITEPKPPNRLTLKEFKTIELEVLTSPRKGLSTPTKLVPPTPDKNELMSPKKTATPKRILFSPSKDGSPSKIIVPPAYQKFLHLVEISKSGTPQLQLPYKYRFLIEVFKCLDTVVAMFFNRKEIITFKKLKPGVQRMLRKNLNESHLAQIKTLYPDAFSYHQMKMRNYGSISKQDYFQLVITPNIDSNGQKMTKIDENNVLESAQSNAMNPQVMIERHKKFYNILLEKVKSEHNEFLKTLDPPLTIPMEKIQRWHPEFDLENCPEIEMAHLPQPPNVEKYSSAKDILSTARNLFNCATPLERVMDRYELAKSDPQQKQLIDTVTTTTTDGKTNNSVENVTATLLKGVPKSLLDKIRAKQAAKALDTITRRPSQDNEAKKFSRLPELARHLRNVFITERKGVLPLENVMKKIENSYRTCLTQNDIETHIKMIAKQCPNWIVFHDVRNTIYLKMTRDLDLKKIIEKLENTANEKLK